MKECNRICEWNNPSNGCVKPETVDCKMPKLFKGAKPQTNADRIRAMSDEELAEFRAGGLCPPDRSFPDCTTREPCSKCWLEYLRQPVKDGA